MYAAEYTDIFDAAEVNFDEKKELATTIAGAMGRGMDQLVIDALSAGSTIAHGSAGMTLGKITQASETLNDNGVPMSDRTMLISAAALTDVLNDTTITSADYNTVRALMAGTIDQFVGFKWEMIETRAEGGLTVATNIRDCFAYHKDAVGMAVGIEPTTTVDYVPQKLSWLTTGVYKAGAVTIDTAGVVKVEVDES
jgi:hypothetical protein